MKTSGAPAQGGGVVDRTPFVLPPALETSPSPFALRSAEPAALAAPERISRGKPVSEFARRRSPTTARDFDSALKAAPTGRARSASTRHILAAMTRPLLSTITITPYRRQSVFV
ncbi:unnamed protein product, partial [Iphiclides podalirius]